MSDAPRLEDFVGPIELVPTDPVPPPESDLGDPKPPQEPPSGDS